MTWRKNNVIKYDYGHLGEKTIPEKVKDHNDWKSTKEALKKYIKFHLSVVQDNTCAYCREEVNFNGYGEPIEHIVPKSLKKNWMYHPKNLCLACYGCNTIKLDKDTLQGGYTSHGNKYADIPLRSTNYIIVHPYFDKHSEYIDSSGIMFKGVVGSRKGANTIAMCELNRLDLLYKRAKRNKKVKNMSDLVMRVIKDPNSGKKEIKAAQDFIDQLIERQKYMKRLITKK